MILAIRVVPPTRIDVETSGRPRRTGRVPHAHVAVRTRPSPTGRDCHSQMESANAIIGTLGGRVQTRWPAYRGRMTTTASGVSEALLPHLRRARDHIDRRYAAELDLAGLAAVAGVSKYHFARSFEAAYGETPIRYLTRRRIERAQDLLRAANLTVTEICMAVGFSSLGSFSTRFSALVGESPTQYRDRWAATGGPRIPGCYLFMMGVVPSTSATSEKPAAHAPA